MKHESDESGIIIYDMHEDYSFGPSSSKKKKTEKEEEENVSDSKQKSIDKDIMARLGGFSGRVYDKLTYRTIEGVKVIIAKDLSVNTDEKGIFAVVGIKPGTYRISVSEEGYEIQSRISTAVAGETTKVESFHLVPSCLAAERPDIIETEEETTEEEIVEFAMETPPSAMAKDIAGTPKSAEAINKETITREPAQAKTPEVSTKTHPDSSIVVEVHEKTLPDIIGKENTIEYTTETVFDEEIFAVYEKMAEETASKHAGILDAEKKEAASFSEVLSVLIEQTRALPVVEEQPGVATEVPPSAERPTSEEAQQVLPKTTAGMLTQETVSEEVQQRNIRVIIPDEMVEKIVLEETLGDIREILPEKMPGEVFMEELSGDFREILPEKMFGETTEENTLEEIDVATAIFEETLERTRRENQHDNISIEDLQAPAVSPELTKNASYMHAENLIISETPSLEEFRGGSLAEKTTEGITVPEEALTTAPEDTWREPAQEISLKNVQEIFLEKVVEETPQEFSIEEIPVETAEEEPVQSTSAQTAITETTQPEDTDREPPEEKEQLKLQWWKLRKKKPRETRPEHPLTPPPVDITLQITTKQNINEKIHDQQAPAGILADEREPSSTTETQKEVPRRVPEDTTPSKEPVTALPEKKQETAWDEQPLREEQPVEPSAAETAHGTFPPEEVPEETGKTILSGGVLLEETASEEVSENTKATLSDQEREAMAPDDNTSEVEGFMGILSAQPNPAFKGLPITITYNLKNVSCDNPDDLLLQLIITSPDTGTVHETFETPITCEKGFFAIGGFTLPTSSYEPNTYKAIMQLFSKKTKIPHPVTETPLQIKSIF